MTTLAANKPRDYEGGNRNALLVVADDIIYEGAAVGQVAASGHARPLTSADRFAGFAEAKADNAGGAAAAIRVRLIESGKIVLAITGLVITDPVGTPVYATDDDTFSCVPTGGVFVGRLHRYVSNGIGVVDFDAAGMADPYAGFVHETKSANYTVTAADAGKWLWVDTDAVVITLPAVEGIAGLRIGNIAAYGVSGLSVSPNANDMIEGPGITAANDKDIVNTKATAQRGDFIELGNGDADGWSITRMRGTWARQA